MERLTPPEGRVVGSLIEKQLTTPQQYPLTLNALVAACNQASNREPVTAYGEEEVLAALETLRERKLVRAVLPSHGRSVVRYRHVLDEVLGVDSPQLALLAVLLLRGPQTVGELRLRSERMADFESMAAIEHDLDLLAGREEPLVERVARRPGQKEDRWADLVSEPAAGGSARTQAPPSAAERGSDGGVPRPSELETVKAELAELREAVTGLRQALAELRDSLGG